jgi:hypothetical protein
MIFCGGRYQPGWSGIFWPTEGTSQPVIISKNWKNLSSALRRKRTWGEALLWFWTCSLGLPASGTGPSVTLDLFPQSTSLRHRPFCDFGPVPLVYQPQAQALLWLWTCSLCLLASGTGPFVTFDLFSRSIILGHRPFCDFRPVPSA